MMRLPNFPSMLMYNMPGHGISFSGTLLKYIAWFATLACVIGGVLCLLYLHLASQRDRPPVSNLDILQVHSFTV